MNLIYERRVLAFVLIFAFIFFLLFSFFVLLLVYKRFNLLCTLCLYLSEIKFYYMETFNLFFARIKKKMEEKDDQNVTKNYISFYV